MPRAQKFNLRYDTPPGYNKAKDICNRSQGSYIQKQRLLGKNKKSPQKTCRRTAGSFTCFDIGAICGYNSVKDFYNQQ